MMKRWICVALALLMSLLACLSSALAATAGEVFADKKAALSDGLKAHKLNLGKTKASESEGMFGGSATATYSAVIEGLGKGKQASFHMTLVDSPRHHAYGVDICSSSTAVDRDKYIRAANKIVASEDSDWGDYGHLLTIGSAFLRHVEGHKLNERGLEKLLRAIIKASKKTEYGVAENYLNCYGSTREYFMETEPNSPVVYGGRAYGLSVIGNGYILSSIATNAKDNIKIDAADMEGASGSSTNPSGSAKGGDIVGNVNDLISAHKGSDTPTRSIQSGKPIESDKPTESAKPSDELSTSYRKGDKGDEVKKLQRRLITLNYLEGKADGDFGGKTETAVRLFQKENKLEQTGIATADVQELLYSSKAKKLPDPNEGRVFKGKNYQIGADLQFKITSHKWKSKYETKSGNVINRYTPANGIYLQITMEVKNVSGRPMTPSHVVHPFVEGTASLGMVRGALWLSPQLLMYGDLYAGEKLTVDFLIDLPKSMKNKKPLVATLFSVGNSDYSKEYVVQ